MPNIVVRSLPSVFLVALAAQGLPDEGQPKDEPPLGPKREALAKRLKDRTPAGRLKAVGEVAALGEEAAPLAKHLCEATMDSSARVAQAALQALAKVRTDLFEPLGPPAAGPRPGPRVRWPGVELRATA